VDVLIDAAGVEVSLHRSAARSIRVAVGGVSETMRGGEAHRFRLPEPTV
jgi:hypothetical protein